MVLEWLLEPLSFHPAKAVFDTGKVFPVSTDQESILFCSMLVILRLMGLEVANGTDKTGLDRPVIYLDMAAFKTLYSYLLYSVRVHISS